MSFMPFILDRSLNAKLIKSIDAKVRNFDDLGKLKDVMTHDIKVLPYGYLEQAFRRAEAALSFARSQQELDLLNSIQMMALHRIQRIHMESRP
jgi:hypothetical protein